MKLIAARKGKCMDAKMEKSEVRLISAFSKIASQTFNQVIEDILIRLKVWCLLNISLASWGDFQLPMIIQCNFKSKLIG